jgi:ribosomal-protein-alanine N-acetyltransferase
MVGKPAETALMSSPAPSSRRLRYERVGVDTLDRFHSLVQDPHVRRYLMDGEVFPIEWSRDRVLDSDALFASRGVGLWLAREIESGAMAGFCGFLVIPSVHAEPQLVYALTEEFTGRGYATEMARAAIAYARASAGFSEIIAGVDEVNAASVRVLEKLAFERTGTQPGAFGNTLVYRLAGPLSPE